LWFQADNPESLPAQTFTLSIIAETFKLIQYLFLKTVKHRLQFVTFQKIQAIFG